jgi:hypothetical protein
MQYGDCYNSCSAYDRLYRSDGIPWLTPPSSGSIVLQARERKSNAEVMRKGTWSVHQDRQVGNLLSRIDKGGQADHTTMASRTLGLPLKAFAGTRPSIQAWRSTRTFATEVAPAPTTLPIPLDTTPITTPVVQDAQSQTSGSKKMEGSTSGKSRPVGVVVSAGKMQSTVKVRLPSQKWNNYLRKVIPILPAVQRLLCTREQCADRSLSSAL